MIHKEIVELWRKHQEVHEFAQAVEAIVRADEREAVCRIVTGLCISDNNAEEINRAIRARGQA